MKRTLTTAAFAAIALVGAAGGTTPVQASVLSAEDRIMCVFLELAHESSCAELEALGSRGAPAGLPPASLVGPSETTGSIVPAGAGEPGGAGEPAPSGPRTVPVRR